jgi:hypothetical protein
MFKNTYCAAAFLIYIFCFFIVTFVISCNCGKLKNKNSNLSIPTSKIPTPAPDSLPDKPDNTPDQADSTAIQKAIQELEKELAKSNPDPRLKDVYEVIKRLPPHKFQTNPDGSLSRTNEEKDGRELFDKMVTLITTQGPDSATPEAVAWLVDQKLLNPNQINEQGISPLENIVADWMSQHHSSYASKLEAIKQTLVDRGATLSLKKRSILLEKLLEDHFIQKAPLEHHKTIFDFLKNQGTTISSAKASTLLEKFIEDQLASKSSLQHLKDIVDFLQGQGGTISESYALGLLENFKKRPFTRYTTKEGHGYTGYIFDLLLKHSAGAIDPTKATELLQHTFDRLLLLEAKTYRYLFDLGADPSIMVIDDIVRNSLLYTSGNFNTAFKELLPDLIANSKIDINATAAPGKPTLAMYLAYQPNTKGVDILEKLLKRADLDINDTKTRHESLNLEETLLDIIVNNCMRTSADMRTEKARGEILQNNKRWLATLNKMRTHPKFHITEENKQKAQKIYKEYIDSFQGTSHEQEAKRVAQEALKILNLDVL